MRAQDISYFGDPVGHWEGDTLVVESVGFNDETWFANGGFFHSYDMNVTERLRREGNIIHYQATVEDPTVLLQPWVMSARELELDPDPRPTFKRAINAINPTRDWSSAKYVTKLMMLRVRGSVEYGWGAGAPCR